MMRALAIHAKRVPTVTPTLSMAKQFAPVPQVTLGQPVIWILTSVLLVGYEFFYIQNVFLHSVGISLNI